MTRVGWAALLAAACTAVTGDFSDVVAIEYTGPASITLEEGDTVRFLAVALGLDGQPLPDVVVVWYPLAADPDTIGFTLDSTTGLLTATGPGGPWPVQGRVEELRVNPPITVTVRAAPDSIAAVEPARDTVEVGADASVALTAMVFDVTTDPTQPVGLAGVRIVFQLADPVAGAPAAAGVALARPGSAPATDPHAVETMSGGGGGGSFVATRVAGQMPPDSIVVEARAFTALGDTVRGSPARFVVVFLSN